MVTANEHRTKELGATCMDEAHPCNIICKNILTHVEQVTLLMG
jgi:hypothetical protein